MTFHISPDLTSPKDDLEEFSSNSHACFSSVCTSWSQQKGDRVQLSSTTFRFFVGCIPYTLMRIHKEKPQGDIPANISSLYSYTAEHVGLWDIKTIKLKEIDTH